MRNNVEVGGAVDSRSALTSKGMNRRDFLKLSGVGLAGAALLGSAGCGGAIGSGAGGGGTIEMDLATVYQADTPQSRAAERFAERVAEKSDGQIQINFFPDSALGTETDNFNAISSGELGMGLLGTVGIDMFAPEFLFFQTPFMMRDIDHVRAFTESDLNTQMVETMDEHNVHLLQYVFRGTRNSTSNKVFETPEDLAGLEFRLPELPTWVAVWNGLGVQANPVALDELYTALETGVVNASEGPYEQFATFSLQEVQDYVINTEHVFEIVEFWIDKSRYDSMTDEQRSWIDEAVEEAADFAREEAEQTNQEYLQELKDGGMEIIEPDREAFLQAARPALEKLFDEQFTVTTYDEVMRLAD